MSGNFHRTSETTHTTVCVCVGFIYGSCVCSTLQKELQIVQLMAFNAPNKEIFLLRTCRCFSGQSDAFERSKKKTRRGAGEDEQIVSTHFCEKPATTTINMAKQCEQ